MTFQRRVKIDGSIVTIKTHDSRDMERIVRNHTAFTSMNDLLTAKGNYRPSIYLHGKSKQAKRELLALAFVYNYTQEARGDDRRVYQGDYEILN